MLYLPQTGTCILWHLWWNTVHYTYYTTPLTNYITCMTWPSDVLHYVYYMNPLMYYIIRVTCTFWCITLYMLHNPSANINSMYHVTPLMYYTTCVTGPLWCTCTCITWACCCTFGLPGPLHLVDLSVQRHDVSLQSLVDAAHTVVLVLHSLQIKYFNQVPLALHIAK